MTIYELKQGEYTTIASNLLTGDSCIFHAAQHCILTPKCKTRSCIPGVIQ